MFGTQHSRRTRLEHKHSSARPGAARGGGRLVIHLVPNNITMGGGAGKRGRRSQTSALSVDPVAPHGGDVGHIIVQCRECVVMVKARASTAGVCAERRAHLVYVCSYEHLTSSWSRLIIARRRRLAFSAFLRASPMACVISWQ